MAMKVAVTGASGFLGRHVVRALSATGAQVTLTSRTGGPDLVALDIAQNALPGVYERLGRPDILVHLAWGGLPNYRSHHHVTAELPQQYAFLERIVAEGLPRLMVTGTCLEHGMQSGPLSEAAPCFPNNPYAHAKHALHRQLEFLQRDHKFELTWARLFYTYGRGQSEKSLWSQFQAAIGRGDDAFDMSGGEQIRDFLPVEEMALELADLARSPIGHGTVNVCSGRPQSVRTLVEGWVAAAAKPIALNLGKYPYPDYEPMAFWGNSSKLQSIRRDR